MLGGFFCEVGCFFGGGEGGGGGRGEERVDDACVCYSCIECIYSNMVFTSQSHI